MIYLIFGEEQYLVREKLSHIIKAHPDAAVEKFDSPSFSALIEAISIPSLFSPSRLIVADGLDLSPDSENFISCISSMPADVVLVIRNPENMDKRSKIFKKIESVGEVHEFKTIPEWEEDTVADFVKKTFAEHGKEISRENAYILVEGIGRNLGLISSEVEKISTYAGDRKTIERQDIEKLMVRSSWDSFSFVHAVFAKNISLALQILERLFLEKVDPVKLLGLLSSQYRMLFKVKLLTQKGDKPFNMAQKLGASPYYINRIHDVSRNFKLESIQSGLEAIYNADLKLKSGFNQKNEMTLLTADLLANA